MRMDFGGLDDDQGSLGSLFACLIDQQARYDLMDTIRNTLRWS